MSVPAIISLATVRQEIADCQEAIEVNNWAISPIDEIAQSFTVSMQSPVDQEYYKIIFRFDNYPEQPFYIDFIDPTTGDLGTTHAYPKSNDSFFHPKSAICHPCSRKSYAGYSGLHGEWQLKGWKNISGSLTNLLAIIDAIYSRISNKHYGGRMA